jgi:NAD(P)-dependent dehydrogenase (short-subunit alcohol dehydrogenase family)
VDVSYFVTGATGFIGRNLIELLLQREGTIYVLTRQESLHKMDALRERWGDHEGRVVPVVGDLSKPHLGVEDAALTGQIDHFFHLAAIYDMKADAESSRRSNLDGTRHAIELAEAIGAGCFHMVSSIAAAGTYQGLFTEDMFEEATGYEHHPYYETKHKSEGIVRDECSVPWRIYRPSMVVGDSQTGEMDKVDGPYYFFKAVQRLRGVLPGWLPLVGIQGKPVNIVPVDFVVKAMDYIAHQPGLDGRAFHLVDPNPLTVGEFMQVLTKVGHAPSPVRNLDLPLLDVAVPFVKNALRFAPPAKWAASKVLDELGIPTEVLEYINYPTTFATEATEAALAGSDIHCPPFRSYAATLWDFWERSLDPSITKDRALRHAVKNKTVLITGASSGIGQSTALKVAAAGGTVLLVARSPEPLERTKREIEALGGKAFVHRCDLSDMDDIDRMAKEVLADHGRVDILINNAGRSIRRSIALSYNRFHDFERTMQLNYFGSVRLILNLLPVMRGSVDGYKGGHIINISSIGVQTNTPRFSAYVASKAALDAFSRCIASEVIGDGVHITTVHMPLVRTPMIAPTTMYNAFPTITPGEAADMICDSIIHRPKRVATTLGSAGELMYDISPKSVDAILHRGYKLFPDSKAAQEGKGKHAAAGEAVVETTVDETPSVEATRFANLTPGVHW